MSATEGPPNHPRTFGEELSRLRESAGLSVQDIAAETKISTRILNALERGDYRFLPEKIFCRNFVIQYAVIVGADSGRLVNDFENAWERFLLASGSHPRLVVEEAAPRRTFRWRFWIPIGIGASILLAAAAVILSGSAPDVDLSPDPRRGTAQRLRPEALPAVPTAGPRPTRVIEEVVENVPAPPIAVTVKVLPDMECWIHFRDRDGVAEQRLLLGGAELRISLAGPAKITVGDAAAVVLEVAGREYRNLGVPGQVVHTEVSEEGLVILGAGRRDE
ncbi:MAG: helix-turn-helix domain-containing protein [Thermoanaerobaculales bacterium]